MALFQRIKTPFAESVPEGRTWTPSGPQSAGDILRQRREALGLDLEDCAAALNIKPGFLAALEEGRPDRLPGPAYAIGFVRAYGDHLGLDSTVLLQRFKAESAALDTKPDLSFPMPLGERSVPGGSMLLMALILAICGYGTWYYLSTADRTRPARVADVPLSLAQPKALPEKEPPARPDATDATAAAPASVVTTEVPGAATTAAAPSSPPPAPAGPQAALAAPASPDTAAPPPQTALPAVAVPAVPAPPSAPSAAPAAVAVAPSKPAVTASATADSAPTATPSAAQSDPAHSYGATGGSSRIAIHATADSWIQVRGADQSILFSRTLKTGDTYRVPDRTGLSLRTGNAGGLEIKVDGHQVPSIGRSGVLRHDVALEPDALSAGNAVRD